MAQTFEFEFDLERDGDEGALSVLVTYTATREGGRWGDEFEVELESVTDEDGLEVRLTQSEEDTILEECRSRVGEDMLDSEGEEADRFRDEGLD